MLTLRFRRSLALTTAVAVLPIGIVLGAQSASADTASSIAGTANANLSKGACSTNSAGGTGFYSSCTGNNGSPENWCADFAKWVWAQNGVNVNGLTPGAGSFASYKNGLHTTPHVGDAVVFDYNYSGWASHVAIVTAVNSDGTITSIGGNQGSNDVTASQVSAHTYSGALGYSSFMGKSISGYVSPDGGTSAPLTYHGDVPVAGKWGGSATTIGVFRDGAWALRGTNSAGNADAVVNFGQAGDVAITGDWDGVGHDELGIYRPSTNTFALRHDDGSSNSLVFGQAGDIPVPGMWDHNGHAQMAIYRPSTNTFSVRHDDGSVSSAALGNPGDVPIVGDWDGVGHTQMGVFRPGTNPGDTNIFALRHDDGTVTTATYGSKGDLPVVGDWSAKGRTTFGVYHPANATFALSNAYAGTSDYIFAFGNGGTWS